MGEGVLTAPFGARAGAMHCEDVAAAEIARAADTPTYVYSASAIRDRYGRLASALSGIPARVHYSCKANGNRAILGLLRSMGSGVDVVSGGELAKALRAVAPEDMKGLLDHNDEVEGEITDEVLASLREAATTLLSNPVIASVSMDWTLVGGGDAMLTSEQLTKLAVLALTYLKSLTMQIARNKTN